jgi:hypothetical protein
MPAATNTILSPVHSAARRLLSLHALTLVAAYTALLWLRLALSSVTCPLRLHKRRTMAMVCLYENCVVRERPWCLPLCYDELPALTITLHCHHAAAVARPATASPPAPPWPRRTPPSLAPAATHAPSLLCCPVQGGYHSDLKRAWSGLEQTVATAAPNIQCARCSARLSLLPALQDQVAAGRCPVLPLLLLPSLPPRLHPPAAHFLFCIPCPSGAPAPQLAPPAPLHAVF